MNMCEHQHPLFCKMFTELCNITLRFSSPWGLYGYFHSSHTILFPLSQTSSEKLLELWRIDPRVQAWLCLLRHCSGGPRKVKWLGSRNIVVLKLLHYLMKCSSSASSEFFRLAWSPWNSAVETQVRRAGSPLRERVNWPFGVCLVALRSFFHGISGAGVGGDTTHLPPAQRLGHLLP